MLMRLRGALEPISWSLVSKMEVFISSMRKLRRPSFRKYVQVYIIHIIKGMCHFSGSLRFLAIKNYFYLYNFAFFRASYPDLPS